MLLSIGLIIFGSLSLIFITQVELIPGWTWDDLYKQYSSDVYIKTGDDINGDQVKDILYFVDILERQDDRIHDTPKYGRIGFLSGINGEQIWVNDYEDPIKHVFFIEDINEDGFRDIFVCKTTVNSSWQAIEGEDALKVQVFPNQYENFILSSLDGTIISPSEEFSSYLVHDVVNFNYTEDNREDLICLEIPHDNTIDFYNISIAGYYYNGTLLGNIQIGSDFDMGREYEEIPCLELFQYDGEPHILYISKHHMYLINLTVPGNYSNYIFEINTASDINSNFDIEEYEILEDLNLDGIPEIIIANKTGSAYLINGINGSVLQAFNVVSLNKEAPLVIKEIPTTTDDSETLVYAISFDSPRDKERLAVYSIDISSHDQLWNKTLNARENFVPVILDQDSNGDGIKDLWVYTSHESEISSELNRYSTIDAMTGKTYGQINLENSLENGDLIGDFDGDGMRDCVGISDEDIIAVSTAIPTDLWLSSQFPLGMYLFIICLSLLVIGGIIAVLKGRELRFNLRKSIKENKLSFLTCIIGIIIVSINLSLFLIQLNLFNMTLITGSLMTQIIISLVSTSILWYACLPLTAAIYNHFAPYFAYIFVKLRKIFFKFSKAYDSDIFIADMKDRTLTGAIIKFKRLLLPTFLSISVSFYIYNFFAPLLGYSQEFSTFGGSDFLSFMAGYTLLCTLPMILSFLIFSFFIAGNILLDDAGVVYYRESKKYKIPGDVEPISIWAQSIVKGIAGISALVAFGTFFLNVDFSGFFTESEDQGIVWIIFGTILVVTMFWGTPFFTSFAYTALAEDIMDLTYKKNVEKFYKILEKRGYDITPRDLSLIYPNKFKTQKDEKVSSSSINNEIDNS